MAGTLNIPLTTLSDGTRHFGPAPVADADVIGSLSLDRTVAGGLNALTSAATLEITVDQSNDGGATWFPLVDATVTGGLVPARQPPKGPGGNAVTAEAGARFAPGTSRQARGTVVTAGGPVTVQGSLTIS